MGEGLFHHVVFIVTVLISMVLLEFLMSGISISGVKAERADFHEHDWPNIVSLIPILITQTFA